MHYLSQDPEDANRLNTKNIETQLSRYASSSSSNDNKLEFKRFFVDLLDCDNFSSAFLSICSLLESVRFDFFPPGVAAIRP